MHKVSYVELHTSNVDQARAFYGELFGWQFKSLPITPRYDTIEGPQAGGVMHESQGACHWLQYVDVNDVAASLKKTEALGGKIMTGKTEVPGQGWFAVVTDPQGAAFALWQKKS